MIRLLTTLITTVLLMQIFPLSATQKFDLSLEKQWQGPFFFIQMADCQLGFFEENVSWDKDIALLNAAVEHINRLQPRFVILCGDITHAYPREPMYESQVRDYKAAVSKIDPSIPLVCLCGNHDVGNSPDRESIAIFEASYNTPHYYSFWVGGVHAIVLNSSLIWDPSNAPDLYEEQLSWFQQQLAPLMDDQNPVHRLVFTHHPWFLEKFDEADQYFVIPKTRRIPFLELMDHSGVSACFNGHYHRNAVAEYNGMPCVTTSALGKPLGDDPSGFRIVKVFEEAIEHEYVSLDQVPESVALVQSEIGG